MRVLIVDPLKTPYVKEIGEELADLQKEVGGFIEAVYPFRDDAAIICNEERKLLGLPLNRELTGEDGTLCDINRHLSKLRSEAKLLDRIAEASERMRKAFIRERQTEHSFVTRGFEESKNGI